MVIFPFFLSKLIFSISKVSQLNKSFSYITLYINYYFRDIPFVLQILDNVKYIIKIK